MSERVSEFAPAKVNLTLKVGRVRADGYHPLQSITVFADWGDHISVEAGEGLTLETRGAMAGQLDDPNTNLALKAAYALRGVAENQALGARIVLDKHLPVAAGLGGGSSDAAACLRALNTLWDLGLSTRQLAEIGTVIGADVPACVHARALVMNGIGETITPLVAWPELYGVIANPSLPVSTGAVFKAYDDTAPDLLQPEPIPALAGFEAVLDRLGASANDLEASALTIEPAIKTVLDALLKTEGARLVRMSGSGASCFALYETRSAANEAAQGLSNQHPGWIVQAVTLAGAL